MPVPGSLRRIRPRLCAAAFTSWCLRTFAKPRNHVRRPPPVSQTCAKLRSLRLRCSPFPRPGQFRRRNEQFLLPVIRPLSQRHNPASSRGRSLQRRPLSHARQGRVFQRAANAPINATTSVTLPPPVDVGAMRIGRERTLHVTDQPSQCQGSDDDANGARIARRRDGIRDPLPSPERFATISMANSRGGSVATVTPQRNDTRYRAVTITEYSERQESRARYRTGLHSTHLKDANCHSRGAGHAPCCHGARKRGH